MYRCTNVDHLFVGKCDISWNNRECLFAYPVNNCRDCAVPPKINQSRNDTTFGDLVFREVHSFRRVRQKHRSLETALNGENYRGADKSLARPGTKKANVSIRMAWISFGALPCRKKKTWWQLASRCCWNRARPWHASEFVSFLVWLRIYQHPGILSARKEVRGWWGWLCLRLPPLCLLFYSPSLSSRS